MEAVENNRFSGSMESALGTGGLVIKINSLAGYFIEL
jgi:hypothetical protein